MLFLITLLLAGPRFILFLWWLLNPGRWDRAFDTFLLPLLGFLFLPWTTLMFVLVAPDGTVSGTDWWPLALGFLIDVISVGGVGRRHAYA